MQSEDWGPYRIEERLGSGGMGAVYRAYDSRLDRWVALKIIHPETASGLKARERLRREARAVAGMSHPSVVQIHDIIEREEEGDCIVMELVEGETLARLLERGPIEPPRSLRFAREIAEGLAAAHAKGIVHRDLKAENVMITAADHPKILDFGLAKQLYPMTAEQTLSVEGRVVGTVHAMSPEQAQGKPVDHRSDLFSLGSLLYEMLVGESPFRCPTMAETLTRLCVHRQVPVREIRPDVPAELSDLIDRLLEKRPEDRPSDSGEVAMALQRLEPSVSASMDPIAHPTLVDLPSATDTVAIPSGRSWPSVSADGPEPPGVAEGGAGFGPRWLRRPWVWVAGLLGLAALLAGGYFLRPPSASVVYVAVPQPEGLLVGEELELVASSVRVALLQGLMGLESVTPLAPDQVDAVQGTSEQIARATAADEVLISRLTCRPDTCHVILSRVDAHGGLLDTRSFDASPEDLLLLSLTVIDELRRAYPGRATRDPGGLRVQRADYEEYLRIRQSFDSREEAATLPDLLDRLRQIHRGSPDFVAAYLLEADIARTRFTQTRDPADLDRAFEVCERAREIAPEDPHPLFTLVATALAGNRVDLAEETLERLQRLRPGAPQVLQWQAEILERRGQSLEAIERMRKATTRRPSSKHLFNLANLEIRIGQVEEAREDLQRLRELDPDHYDGNLLLAQIELVHGDPQQAAELFGKLVDRNPGIFELTNLGVAYLVLERFDEAAESFQRAVELAPASPFVLLNLADAELLRGHEETALALYRQVLDLIDKDPGAGTWQHRTVMAQSLAHLGRGREAVAQAQRALRLAPDNAQAVFEVAVVYALVGDTTSALASIERAASLGIDAVWFGFPWFDELRSHPDFPVLVTPRDSD